MDKVVVVNHHVSIPLEELSWRFSRASGPGGQNVNRTATRVEVIFDVDTSPSLSEMQKQLLHERLGVGLDRSGVLHVFAQSERSQLQNRADALLKFASLLRQALTERIPRRISGVPRGSRERRLLAKRQRARLRSLRQSPLGDE
jgi:ribosome-associated protein